MDMYGRKRKGNQFDHNFLYRKMSVFKNSHNIFFVLVTLSINVKRKDTQTNFHSHYEQIKI
jgi:hypothetical protein